MSENKWLLPKIMGCFAFIAINISCEKEDFKEQNLDSQKFRVKEVKLQNLMNESRFRNLLQSITDNSSLQRSSFENQNGFTITNENVKVIETDSLTSYTMLIVSDNSTDDVSINNLVIQEDIFNNQKAAIYKYTPNSISTTIHNSFHFDGTIDKFSIRNFSGLKRVSQQMSIMSDCYDYALMCNYGGSEHPAGVNCTRTYVKTVKVLCSSPPFDGGFGDTGGGGGDGPNEFPSDDNNEIITTPILTTESPKLLTTPCNKLKTGTSSTQYINSFNNINKPEVLALPFEYGFAQVNYSYVFSRAVGGEAVPIPNGAKNYTHTHPNRPKVDGDGNPYHGNVKIHSPDDIYQLIVKCQRNNGSEPTNAFGVTISDEGIFALTILEPFILDINMQNKWKDFEDKYFIKSEQILTDYKGFSANEINIRKEKLQKMLLSLLKELGLENKIGLFERTVDNSTSTPKINWQRKKIDSSGNLTPEDC